MKVIEWLRRFCRFWHVRIAAAVGLLAGAIVSQPGILGGLVTYVPPHLRPAAAAAVGVIVFALPTYVKRGKRALPHD